MNRRILIAIVAVTALGLAAFGAPLAIAAQRLYLKEALIRLEREAISAGVQVSATFQATGDPVELPRSAEGSRWGLYSPGGVRLSGNGPDRGGREVALAAARGRIVDTVRDGRLVVTTPLSSDEKVFAVIRAELPQSAVAHRFRGAWLAMGLLVLVAMAVAAMVGRYIARRLSAPVQDLARAASRLGAGDFTARTTHSGIPEIDEAAAALDSTATRLGKLLGRERSFSSDVSHQLRTPLTGLRVHLESALTAPAARKDEAIKTALGQADRLERTVDDLLVLARDTHTDRGVIDLASVAADLETAWHGALAADGRPLHVEIDAQAPSVQFSAGAVRQILDVLVSNALEHGSGVVRIQLRSAAGGVAVDVSDEGRGVGHNPETIFSRRSGQGERRGIGLALARSLAEAEGGRLLLRGTGASPTFTLLLPAADGL